MEQMMPYEEYLRIWEDYTQKETVQTPIGVMVGKPSPPGSTIPWYGYTMLIEDGPHKGEAVEITGLGGGHGKLFINTRTHGTTGISIEYEQPQEEYTDDDAECPECSASEDATDEGGDDGPTSPPGPQSDRVCKQFSLEEFA